MTTPALPGALGSKPGHVSDFVGAAFAGGVDPRAIAVVSVPAPVVPVETLIEAAPNEDALVWDPAEGPAFSAVGSRRNPSRRRRGAHRPGS